MVNRILTLRDDLIVPNYVALFNNVLAEMSPFYNNLTIEEARSQYTVDYILKHLDSVDKVRFIGHFSDQNLDGLLIERFDNDDGNRTTINWVMARKKRQGIGSDLIRDCISRAKDENKDNVTLGVSLKNNEARNLYERLGFISGGRYKNKHNLSMEIMGYIFD